MRDLLARAWGGIVVCIAGAALVACGDAVAPCRGRARPTSSSTDVNVSGIDSVRRVPSPEDWRAFWTAAEEAGVRHWGGRYAAEGVVDGVGWNLRLLAADQRVEAEGSNAYPDGEGDERELEVTRAFERFRSAIGDLTGR